MPSPSRARISTSAASSASAIVGLVVSLRTNQSKASSSPSARTPDAIASIAAKIALRAFVVGRHQHGGAALEGQRSTAASARRVSDDDRAGGGADEGQRDPADVQREEDDDQQPRAASVPPSASDRHISNIAPAVIAIAPPSTTRRGQTRERARAGMDECAARSSDRKRSSALRRHRHPRLWRHAAAAAPFELRRQRFRRRDCGSGCPSIEPCLRSRGCRRVRRSTRSSMASASFGSSLKVSRHPPVSGLCCKVVSLISPALGGHLRLRQRRRRRFWFAAARSRRRSGGSAIRLAATRGPAASLSTVATPGPGAGSPPQNSR